MSTPEPMILLRTAPDRRRADEWALALSADGLSPGVRPRDGGFEVGVPASQASRAADVLRMYDRENRRGPRGAEEPIGQAAILGGLVLSFLMIGFFFLTGAGGPLDGWLGAGSGDAFRILHGEPWRAVTALTLHVDFPHALANALFLAVLLPALLRSLGWGLAPLALLLSGIAGNILSAIFHGADHRAVGVSTALFGAVGLLSALAVGRRARSRGGDGGGHARAWIPIGAGLALFAMLGVGTRADLAAHLFGLLSGVAIGALLAMAGPCRAREAAQLACALLAAAIVAAAWIAALGARAASA